MNKTALISEELLLSYGATRHEFNASEIIFNEGDIPRFYYQIIEGRVKLNHEDDEGKEFIQSILSSGESVCELLLFIDKSYPVNAVCLEKSSILRLSKANFFEMIEDHPGISIDVNKFISERLYQKFVLMQSNSSIQPQARLRGVLNYFKSFSEDQSSFSFEVTLTRKQLASITGLRIETVIRTIKKLEKEEFLKIRERKIFV